MYEPYWWTKDWTDEQKQIAGDPANRTAHMHRTTPLVDAFERRIDADMARSGESADDIFGPIVSSAR